MITTSPRYSRRMPKLAKLLFGIAFFLGIFISSFKLLYAYTIPFENTLPTIFSSWFNTWYYSNARFHFGGNSFVGTIFWQTGLTLSTPQEITINSWWSNQQTIRCTTQLRGIYYNNQRGRRVWPLDTGNLALLSTQWSGYQTMTMTNGFFTNCSRVAWAYTPLLNDVYGQIDHNLWGQTGFRMIAGIAYNFTGNLWNATFDHTFTMSPWWNTWYIFDTNGGIWELNMNIARCQGFTSTPATPPAIIIAQGSGMTFTCFGNNVTGYRLDIFVSWNTTPFYSSLQSTTANFYPRTTWQALTTWDWIATCTVLGTGSSTGPQCWSGISFHVGITWTTPPPPPPAGTWCSPNFQWEISFSSLAGSNVVNVGLGTFYTNRTGVTMQLAATEPTNFVVSGQFTTTPRIGTYNGNSIYSPIFNPAIVLQNVNSFNNFASIYTTGALLSWCSYTDAAKRIYVDTIPPTPAPVLALSVSNLCPSLPLPISRSASSYDTGAGLGYYIYEISPNSAMTWILLNWMVSGTVTSTSLNISLLPLWTYYVRIQGVDNVGNASPSNIISFTASQQYCGVSWTGIVIVTPTIRLRNVNLDTVYRSDPIWILWLTGPTLLNISKGMLFINNGTGIWMTGTITSADTVYIEVVSSNAYDTTITSNISILGRAWTFSVTTKKSNCVLSTAEKLVIQNIYADLKSQYNNDLSKYSEFLNTFQSMVQDESSLSSSCSLEYLLSLIESDFWSTEGIDTSNHITPNCKEYSIGYDNTEHAYYAPEMINRYYFINRESLIRHLDYYNPGDCHINTYGTNFRTSDATDPMLHIAPNGKIYHFVWQYGGFSATEFMSPKYFDSLTNIKMYIDLRNPPKEIWKHIIDIWFTPIVYAAPNGKEYKIYKTDRWYMSYKLMKVRYYLTLSELKTYIDKNNPSKR